MELARKRRPAEILRGFFLLSHPGPVFLHTVAIFMLVLLAAWPHFVWRVIGLLVAAHLAMQLSIAILNDYCDRRQDAAGKKRKPIPLGLVRPREALIAGILLIPVMILLLLPLNPLALLISLIYLAFGQSYNLGLKATPFSGIVFALAIPLIPVYAFVGVGRVVPLMLWLVPVAALLGITLNVANSLSDLEEDAVSGVRTLAVALGLKRSLIVCPLLIFLSIILIGTLTVTRLVPARAWIIAPTLLIGCLALVVLLLCFGPERSARARRLYFYFVAATCLVLAAGWLTGALL
jgi:4-hydroxybenzoate polyprenyltransferase